MRRGFTLIELLVVMVIIALLAVALIVIISGVVEGQKVSKTAAMIKALSSGCNTYFTLNRTYPPDDSPEADPAQNLHWHLASEFDQQISVDPPVTKRHKPIITDFRSDWLRGNPSDTFPTSSGDATPIVDTWGTSIHYEEPGPGDLGFLIRSYGPDKNPGTGDEIDNENPDIQ